MAASFKLGSLLLKTLSKPLANSLKRRANESATFEKFCIGLAQQYNKADLKLKMRFLDYDSAPIKPLSEARALELGVGAALILAETYRSISSAKKKSEIVKDDISTLIGQVNRQEELNIVLQVRMAGMMEQVAELTKGLEEMMVERERERVIVSSKDLQSGIEA